MNPPIIELCRTDEAGTSCIAQSDGLVIWGSTAGSWQEGFSLVLAAFFAGFAVALVKRTFFDG